MFYLIFLKNQQEKNKMQTVESLVEKIRQAGNDNLSVAEHDDAVNPMAKLESLSVKFQTGS